MILNERVYMGENKILGIETANPALQLTQQQIWDSISKQALSRTERSLYQRFLSDPSIRIRHAAVEDIDRLYQETPDQAAARFERYAPALGAEAVEKCLRRFSLDASRIDALIVTTCTGYLCPGLTSYVAGLAGFREDIFTLDLTGLGCGAALPALQTADHFLATHPENRVIVLCVEICTAAVSWGEKTGLILSNAIFADGAAACLLSNHKEDDGYALKRSAGLLWPQFRDDLRFKTRDNRLCNVLTKDVPAVAGRAVQEIIGKLSKDNGRGIAHYAFHPGGRKILDTIAHSLQLDERGMLRSREILRDYGNMSSPSVLFVLKRVLEQDQPRENEAIGLFAFGAGFTAFGAVLQK